MITRTFNVISFIAMVLTFTAAALCLAGITITGFYPGIIVLLMLTVIPPASRFYVKKINEKSNSLQRRYFMLLTVLNILVILVVLWMSFVIVHDRVLQDCC